METNIKHQINKKYIMKRRQKRLQKQIDRYISFKESHRSYYELQNKIKALEEHLSMND